MMPENWHNRIKHFASIFSFEGVPLFLEIECLFCSPSLRGREKYCDLLVLWVTTL